MTIPIYTNREGNTVTLKQVYEAMIFYDSALKTMVYLMEDVFESQAFNNCLNIEHQDALFFIRDILQRMRNEIDSVLCPDHMNSGIEETMAAWPIGHVDLQGDS
jgi:hypothetical protein